EQSFADLRETGACGNGKANVPDLPHTSNKESSDFRETGACGNGKANTSSMQSLNWVIYVETDAIVAPVAFASNDRDLSAQNGDNEREVRTNVLRQTGRNEVGFVGLPSSFTMGDALKKTSKSHLVSSMPKVSEEHRDTTMWSSAILYELCSKDKNMLAMRSSDLTND
ncbi:hypothetical protein MAR_014593, partial [Mya arenaria]